MSARRRLVLTTAPLLACGALVAALLVATGIVDRPAEQDVSGTPAEVDRHEFTTLPEPERAPYTPAEASAVVVTDPAAPALQSGTVVAELSPHELPGFELLGVTWTEGVPTQGAEVQVRWRQDGTWSPWTRLDVDTQEVEGGIPGTEPKWVGPSDAAQARVVAQESIDPVGLTLVTVAPGETPTLTPAAAAQPAIISRAQWGSRANSSCDSPRYGTMQGTIVHHTAGSNSYTAAQSAGIVRSIQAYHMDGQNWCDLGYNFLVDRYGQIFEGRAGGITNTPRGAHAGNFDVNLNTTGVSLMGTFVNDVPPQAMKDAVVRLVAWRHSIAGIPAKGTYRLGGKTLNRIAGHYNVVATACPGARTIAWMDAPGGMRDQVEQAMSQPMLRGAIKALFEASGGEDGPLGPPLAPEQCGLRGGGCGQYFRNGMIYWAPVIEGSILLEPALSAWQRQGWENGPLGYPTSSQVCGLRDGGCGQHFENGMLYWTPGSPAQVIREPALSRWRELGWEGSALGYPTSGQICGLADGGCGQYFENGMLYWTAATGAQPVWGTSLEAWRSSGLEQGALRYPVAAEECGLPGDGCRQRFEGGEIHWSPSTGAIVVGDPAYSVWRGAVGTSGDLGAPTSSQICGLAENGCGQYFQNGMIYTSPATGTHPLLGDILLAWRSAGWERGPVGYPTSAPICGLRGDGCGQYFQNGMIYTSPTTGTHPLLDPALAAWQRLGWEGGTLGYPSSSAVCGLRDGGCGQYFENGMLYWSASTGAQPIWGAVLSAWRSAGYESGRLGYPLAAEACTSAGCTQAFQGGTITWTRSTGASSITYGAGRS